MVFQIMPLAFIASSDEDPDVASFWKDVWSESSSSQSAAARLYMTDILALLLEGKPLTISLALRLLLSSQTLLDWRLASCVPPPLGNAETGGMYLQV